MNEVFTASPASPERGGGPLAVEGSLLRWSPFDLEAETALFLRCYRSAWLCAHGSLLGFEENATLMGARYRASTSPKALQKLTVGEQFGGILALDERRGKRQGICWISFLFVEEKFRRQGLGRVLIGAAAERAKELGREELQLCAAKNNPALGFYEKLGFTVCGTEPGALEPLLKLRLRL